ncbi:MULTISPECIES: hypothetical protein [Caballeronia]|jgi:hypothetical protein|uniref:Uncharacterized protein n=1 Tax=Caballeronia zhejiangensis TaxID=871203 RepID=A0A656QWP9_9BURK|nr:MULTISPECIES: hypothetical protein [Caballeronia]EKS71199.1 hypothetical protein BURK_014813 [Burkholderia sp. SJ98]KDR34218.1 hypothetical protein BG60_03455 [Caballeronia zhejiangensis]MCG7403067.1 hypothetical protein [Caballeronia zhejiangensis]MCI1043890.1 hypothetical protein [Caballeronia zhejiangensis]MDR5766709.1 hypothetical protein [Caballeronia sp. LZ028]
MPHFLTHYWQALSGPSQRARERSANDAHAASETTRAEQLEHISVYARAGYFNMGYTVDAFQLPGESPLH